MDRLKSKVTLITGGGSGIGRLGTPEDIANAALFLNRTTARSYTLSPFVLSVAAKRRS